MKKFKFGEFFKYGLGLGFVMLSSTAIVRLVPWQWDEDMMNIVFKFA